MNFSKIFGLMILAGAMFVAGAKNCAAQPGGNYYDYAPNAPLTQQQQMALQQILAENSAKLAPLHEELATKEAELQGELDSTAPDQGRITALSREIGELRGRIMSAQVEMRGKLVNAGIPAVPAQRYGQPGPQWMMGGCAPNCFGVQGGWGGMPCWGGQGWGYGPRHGRGHHGWHGPANNGW